MKKLSILLFLLSMPAAAGAAEVCASAGAGVAITDISIQNGLLKASGTWTAQGASGVLLEYRIDSDRMQTESRTGTSGTWEYTEPVEKIPRCGRHTLRVFVFPSVTDGTRLAHCLERSQSDPRNFNISCAPVASLGFCEWECADEPEPRCAGLCSGSARGGSVQKVASWGLNGTNFEEIKERTPEGTWTFHVTCSPGDKVSFKVRDLGGSRETSNVAERSCGEN
jgi:hypothetical protein